ncbi:ELWxxDGT repeat protein [Pyxidicoccus sp. 3LFB2]
MKSWRGVPVLVSVVSGLMVGCGPVPEGEVASGEEQSVPESEVAVEPVTVQGGLVSNGGWEVCDDAATRVRDIHPSASSAPDELVEIKGRLIFAATDPGHGRELWVTKGANKETSLLKDVRPGEPGSSPRSLTRVGNQVFFVAHHDATGPELWRTDGTEKGTELVKDVFPGPAGSVPEQLTAVDDTLYFTANDGEHGRELWRSDGTARGTVLVKDFLPGPPPGPADLGLQMLTAWDKGLALAVYDNASFKAALWAVDKKGRVSRLFSMDYGVFSELEPVGRQLFFTADEGSGEADLWVTRETPGTARHVRHFDGEHPSSLTALGDVVYFQAGAEGFFGDPGDPLHGGELWRSDGTPWGTWVVRDINPGPASSAPSHLVVVDRTLYFAAEHRDTGRELWRSDGTPWGTWLVRDIEPGDGDSDPGNLTEESGWLFFSALRSGHGREVWYSNGKPWDTKPLMDIAAGMLEAKPLYFERSGWDVYFQATDSNGDQELWSVPFRPARYCGDRTF